MHGPLSEEKSEIATVVQEVEFVWRVSLLATSTGKHLPLLSDTAAPITEFDGRMSRPIDVGHSSLNHHPAVGTGTDDWVVRSTILSQHGTASSGSGGRVDYRQLTYTP